MELWHNLEKSLGRDVFIRLRVTIHNEDNNPDANENKSVEVTINGPEAPLPVLALTPANIRTRNRQHTFTLANTGPAGADARNVRIGTSVLAGSQYVRQVSCSGSWNRIGGGCDKHFSASVRVNNSAWRRAPAGTEIIVRIQITQETNNPDENVGRVALYTVYK